MPNDRDLDLNSTPDQAAVPPSWPPRADSASGSAPVTWALVDGLGVYTASAGSPFLTAPPPPSGAPSAPEPTVGDGTDTVGYELRELREPLRCQVQGVALRCRLSEAEISGLVTAVLELIARHLRIGGDRAGHGQSEAGTLEPRG